MQLARRVMYDLVWSKPVTQVAAELGVSSVGLAKICERHRVPTPPRGYWQKLEAGQKVKQAIFVEVEDPKIDRIDINATEERLPPLVRDVVVRVRTEREARRAAQRQIFAAPPQPQIKETKELETVVRQTAKTLRNKASHVDGVARALGEMECGVEIGVASIERSIALLDLLTAALAARKMPVKAAGKAMQVSVGPDKIDFRLKELTKWLPYEPTEADLVKEAHRLKQRERASRNMLSWSSDLYGRSYPEKFQHRTGQLFVQVETYADGHRRKWADGIRHSVESLIPAIVDGFEIIVAARKASREDYAERERRRADLQRRRNLFEARSKRETDRQNFGNALIEKHAEIRRLRNWLAEAVPTAKNKPGSAYARMYEWVQVKLDGLCHEVSAEGIDQQLTALALFPAAKDDELHDPLGEPPPRTNYWDP